MDKKYVVYQHVTPDNMYYFGATQNVERRWSRNGAEYKRTALQPYIEKFGWDNIKHIVLFENQTKENALWIEDFLITTAREDGVCINKNRSGNVSKEEGYNKNQMKYLREQNHENEVRKQKQYYETNKDKIREYREQNKDKIKEQSKQYREQNKDKIKEQSKQYYEENKQQRREYQREYYKRKKLEKQLKEIETTTLF